MKFQNTFAMEEKYRLQTADFIMQVTTKVRRWNYSRGEVSLA
jgi:hypothetical protein